VTKLINFGLIFINIILAVSGQLAIKAGMKQVGYIKGANFMPLILAAFTNPYVILGLFFYVLATVTWILVLSRVDLSFAYPLLSLGYILILILSVTVLKETVSFVRILGTLLIIVGVILIFRS